MSFFECNLPRFIEPVFEPDLYVKLEETVERVYERTEKLNEALAIAEAKTGMKPNTFHGFAKAMFDALKANGRDEHFDDLSAEEIAGYACLMYDGSEAPERLEFPNAIVFYDTAFVTTKDWESLRHLGIGGSESSVTEGVSPFGTKEGLYHNKVGTPELMKYDDRQAIFDRGHVVEPNVIKAFCRLTGAEEIPETRMFQSKRYPVSTANIDAILRMPTGEICFFEAKSTLVGKKGDWMGKKVPPYYLTQCHQYMGVMDDPRVTRMFIGCIPVADVTLDGTYIGSAYSEEFFHHEIQRDDARSCEIMQAEEEFWNTYVVNNICPPPSGSSELDKEIALRYYPSPLSDPEIPAVTLPYDAWAGKIEALKEAEKKLSDAKAALEICENERDARRKDILDAMEGSQRGLFVDDDKNPVFEVKNRPQTRISFDTAVMKDMFPDAYEKCKKESTFLRFTSRAYR